MSDQNNRWINASVFYNSSSWHHLITECILPFISKCRAKGLSEKYCIYLSTHRGDHIKIAVKPTNNTNLEPIVLARFTRFLASNPSPIKPVSYPLTGFFMDHPGNSVMFNLYEYAALSTDKNDYLNFEGIRECISQAIIDALSNEEIVQENIYTFLIYMQLGIIKAAYTDIRKAGIMTYAMSENLSQEPVFAGSNKTSYSEDTGFQDLFLDNKEILLEIVKDIWDDSKRIHELKWLYEWEKSCKKFIDKEDSFQQSYIILSKLVYEQVGLKSTDQLFIATQLISETFELANVIPRIIYG